MDSREIGKANFIPACSHWFMFLDSQKHVQFPWIAFKILNLSSLGLKWRLRAPFIDLTALHNWKSKLYWKKLSDKFINKRNDLICQIVINFCKIANVYKMGNNYLLCKESGGLYWTCFTKLSNLTFANVTDSGSLQFSKTSVVRNLRL